MRNIKLWWDSICSGCGQCCCDKLLVKKMIKKKKNTRGTLCLNKKYAIDYTSPCVYLDVTSGDCLVYEKRFSVCEKCIPMTIFHALFCGFLPSDCAYVRKFRFWNKNK